MKEKFTKIELKSLQRKIDFFDFTKKSNLIVYLLTTLVILIVSIIAPFLPPRQGSTKWILPQTLEEYFAKFNSVWTFLFLLIIFGLAFKYLRLKIDLGIGHKTVRKNEIKGILNFGTFKILILSNLWIHVLNLKQDSYKTVKIGQYLKTNRTVTFRLLNYKISEQ